MKNYEFESELKNEHKLNTENSEIDKLKCEPMSLDDTINLKINEVLNKVLNEKLNGMDKVIDDRINEIIHEKIKTLKNEIGNIVSNNELEVERKLEEKVNLHVTNRIGGLDSRVDTKLLENNKIVEDKMLILKNRLNEKLEDIDNLINKKLDTIDNNNKDIIGITVDKKIEFGLEDVNTKILNRIDDDNKKYDALIKNHINDEIISLNSIFEEKIRIIKESILSDLNNNLNKKIQNEISKKLNGIENKNSSINKDEIEKKMESLIEDSLECFDKNVNKKFIDLKDYIDKKIQEVKAYDK